MKPALIHKDPVSKRWVSWNEDGRYITYGETYSVLQRRLRELGYAEVSPNSYLAATIRDKIRLRIGAI